MEQSLTENELKYMGRNSLNPGQNNSLGGTNQFNPYNTQQLGPSKATALPQSPPNMTTGSSGFLGMAPNPTKQLLRTQNLAGPNLVRKRYNLNDPYQRPPTSKIELSRMLRCEREEKMLQQQKMQQKFENFNKILKQGGNKQTFGAEF